MTEEQSQSAARSQCQHPDCGKKKAETYVDPNGNEIVLCERHYFDAVYPPQFGARLMRKDEDEEKKGFMEKLTG